MALLFCDSFDHYGSAEQLLKWTGTLGNLATGPSASAVRSGSQGYRVSAQTGGQSVYKALGANYTTLICGFAVKTNVLDGSTMFGFYDGGTNQIDLLMGTNLAIRRNGTTLATGATVLSTGVFYYVELKVTFDNSAGSYELRINGVTELSASGIDTTGSANNFANRIALLNSANSTTAHDFDDLYLCDTTGSAPNNTFLGDVRVEALFPNGNGNSSQFTGSDGDQIDNYLLVDDTTAPDEDSTYVADGTVTDKDTYAFTDPTPTTGTIFGVQLTHYSRKTDAGTRSLRSLARLSGTETDNGADQPLSTSYAFYTDMRETKPGGGAWSVSDVASAEFGMKVAA